MHPEQLYDNLDGSILVKTCRSCSTHFDFLLEDSTRVRVICGKPDNDMRYRAVSYLWEKTSLVPLKCYSCSSVKNVPMRDPAKLASILNFVQGGTIWLDALSIDQDDPKDLDKQLGVMGDIYRHATTVSVLLPATDEGAYKMLKELAITSDLVFKRRHEFGIIDKQALPIIASPKHEIPELADNYLSQIAQWDSNISKWKYWTRAWTFQEWTMAAEIEIAYEGAPPGDGLQNIKNIIVSASSIIGQWKVRNAAPSADSNLLVAQLRARENASQKLNLVRKHFPFQDFLVSDEEEDPQTLRTLTSFSPIHSISNGTHMHLRTQRPKVSRLRSLLTLALNVMSTSKRSARFEADLIACWASMCNISYSYSKHDTFALALYKVITALRQQGFRIYNFLVNTDAGETDIMFLEYAAAMQQSNSQSEAYLLGSPVFVGRADTVIHIRNSLAQTGRLMPLPRSFEVTLQRVDGVGMGTPVPFTDIPGIISTFNNLVTGEVDGKRLTDVAIKIGDLLHEFASQHPTHLQRYSLLPISPTALDTSTAFSFNTWAIYPSHIAVSSLFTARESLNGTLVLVSQTATGAQEAQLVSYINMTHQRHGTYLVKCDEEGIVDIVFRKQDSFLRDMFAGLDLGIAMSSEWGVMDTLDQARDVKILLDERRLQVTCG